jgi:hypothetical protein
VAANFAMAKGMGRARPVPKLSFWALFSAVVCDIRWGIADGLLV